MQLLTSERLIRFELRDDGVTRAWLIHLSLAVGLADVKASVAALPDMEYEGTTREHASHCGLDAGPSKLLHLVGISH